MVALIASRRLATIRSEYRAGGTSREVVRRNHTNVRLGLGQAGDTRPIAAKLESLHVRFTGSATHRLL